MDPFAIYDDHYKKLQEAVGVAIHGDQISALIKATQVAILVCETIQLHFLLLFSHTLDSPSLSLSHSL